MVAKALPDKILLSHEEISGGCANLNIKINCANESQPLLLRVYLRDQDASYREQRLASLIKSTISIPEVYFIGAVAGYRFAITQFKFGITLRDLLMEGDLQNIENTMFEVGRVLAKIHAYKFPQAGFFDTNLNINDTTNQSSYLEFANKCLSHLTTIEKIGQENISKIDTYFTKYKDLFPDTKDSNLVHGDFDPANILVDQYEREWKITAVLDWEFAFAGSTLQDIANMLRYAHKMPDIFTESFLKGLKAGGINLPPNWQISIHLLNLLSLLDFLIRCIPNECPNQCADIYELIIYIIQKLDEQA